MLRAAAPRRIALAATVAVVACTGVAFAGSTVLAASTATTVDCPSSASASPTEGGVSITTTSTCVVPTPPPSTATVTATATVPGPTQTVTVTASPTPTVTSTPTPTPTPTSPPAAPADVVIGASLGQPLPAAQTLDAVRFYSASWTSKLQGEYAKGARVFVVSTKDSTPTNTVAMVKAAPADAEFYITAHHEPDDDIKNGTLTPSSWCSTMNAFGRALAGFPNVEFGPIQNGSYGRAAWTTDSAPCDKSLWSFWGMDRYSPNYENPVTQFAEGRDYAKVLGLPLVIGETGADPANATAQKTFATQARTWSLDPANDAAVVLWWQQTGYTFANADVQRAFLG